MPTSGNGDFSQEEGSRCWTFISRKFAGIISRKFAGIRKTTPSPHRPNSGACIKTSPWRCGTRARRRWVAANQPPLYYALQTIPYWLGSGGTLLDRLELMRLLSALMAGLTALFAYLFVCEALPGVSWAWTVGGLGVALAPLLGFMSGAVNPDAMLAAVSAGIFFLLAGRSAAG